jgi:hypothetical protein
VLEMLAVLPFIMILFLEKMNKTQGSIYLISEPEENHYLVIDKFKNDPDVMHYFLKHAYKGEAQ